MRALNHLLRNDSAARDEYILRLELHSRLASDPDLFVSTAQEPSLAGRGVTLPQNVPSFESSRRGLKRKLSWAVALAACFALLAAWGFQFLRPSDRKGATSKAIAMLDRVVDAQWNQRDDAPRLGAPLEPGWLRLKSGLAQIVFYSGARVVLEGPGELQLVSPKEAFCKSGRFVADIPPQARGFRIGTPQGDITDLGTSVGLAVRENGTELHVFEGNVSIQGETLREGFAALVGGSGLGRRTAANPSAFASLFELQQKSAAADALRF